MKLYLTLEDDDGQVVESVMDMNDYKDGIGEDEYAADAVVDSMIETLKESKKPL